MRKRIKIFGERNTGTRALKQMFARTQAVTLAMPSAANRRQAKNWAVLTSAIDQHYQSEWRKLYNDALRDNERHRTDPLTTWKHAAPLWHDSFHEHAVDVVFLVRNPYSWALSTARKPYHMKAPRTADFDVFVTRPWLTERRDNAPPVLGSVLELWNIKLRAYQDFAQQARLAGLHPQVLVFEDFVADPLACVRRILQVWQLRSRGLVPILRSTKQPDTNLAELQAYYAGQRWKQRLTRSSVALINGLIDWDLAGQFNYQPLDPADFPDELPQVEKLQFSFEMMNLDLRPEIDLHRKTGAAATA